MCSSPRPKPYNRTRFDRVAVAVLLCVLAAVPHALAQTELRSGSDELALRGEIGFWNQGEATVVEQNWNAPVDPDGGFELLLRTPGTGELKAVREYDGEDCLTSSNPDSRYLHVFFLDVALSDGTMLPMHLNTPRFDEQPGQSVAEFHFYSDATTIHGRCTIDYDGWSAVYEFPVLQMQAGWNVLTATVVESGEESVSYRIGVGGDSLPAMRWEVDAPGIGAGEWYAGIGASLGYHDAGLELTEVFPEGPANLAGLEPGDVVTEIDGEPTLDMYDGAAILRLLGPAGEPVSLEVRRGTEQLRFEVVRAFVRSPEDPDSEN